MELLEILADKKHKRYKEMREWVDSGFTNWYDDREHVSIEEINMRLEGYKEHAKFLLGDMF